MKCVERAAKAVWNLIAGDPGAEDWDRAELYERDWAISEVAAKMFGEEAVEWDEAGRAVDSQFLCGFSIRVSRDDSGFVDILYEPPNPDCVGVTVNPRVARAIMRRLAECIDEAEARAIEGRQ